MTAIFYVYDTVDREVVHASEEWPGRPNSIYRPVYWAGDKVWILYVAEHDNDRPNGSTISADQVPEAVRLAHMLLT